MRQYAIKRIALFFPTVLLLTIIVFVLMSIIPGDWEDTVAATPAAADD